MSKDKIAIKNSIIALSAGVVGSLLVLFGIANRGLPSDNSEDLKSARNALKNIEKTYVERRGHLIQEAKTFAENEKFISSYLNCSEELNSLQEKADALEARIIKLQKDSTKRAEMLKTPFIKRFKINNNAIHAQIKNKINNNQR